jgi:predicted transcriptional regulator
MTLTLTPETESQLTAIAAQRGVSPEEALAELLTEARASIERERQEVLEGLQQGTAEIGAGDWVPLEDLRRDLHEHARKRRQSDSLSASESCHAPG